MNGSCFSLLEAVNFFKAAFFCVKKKRICACKVKFFLCRTERTRKRLYKGFDFNSIGLLILLRFFL